MVTLGRSYLAGGKFMANADHAPVLIPFPPAPSIFHPSLELNERPVRRPVAAGGSLARTPDVEFFVVLA
jgi:hypothetical protein